MSVSMLCWIGLPILCVYMTRKCTQKYDKLKTLYHLVSHDKSQFASTIWVMTKLLFKAWYLWLWQKMNKSLKQINKNMYILEYALGGQVYKIVILTKRGPRKLLHAYDHENNDITEELASYLGPMENFHTNVFSPYFFDKEQITVMLSNGEEKTFERYHMIEI